MEENHNGETGNSHPIAECVVDCMLQDRSLLPVQGNCVMSTFCQNLFCSAAIVGKTVINCYASPQVEILAQEHRVKGTLDVESRVKM